jgi:hypothetical protein
MSAPLTILIRDLDGSVVCYGAFDESYTRAIASLWKSAADRPSRAAILRGLRPPLEAARQLDPIAVTLTIDGVEIG